MIVLDSIPGLGEDLAAAGDVMRSSLMEASRLFSAMADALAPAAGKMIRPALAFIAARAVPGWEARRDKIIRAAAAVELLHLATLVHDDVIDGADKRRGRPTPRALYGAREAVLLGDYVFSSALRAGLGSLSTGSVSTLARAVERVCEGEILQGRARFEPEASERTYLRRIHAKTAALFSASARVGVLEAGGEPALAASFGRAASALGMAFQIDDDVLDFTGDEGALGKPADADLADGVFTLPVVLALGEEEAGGEARKPLRALLSRHPYGMRRKKKILGLIEGYGGIELARSSAFAYARRSRERVSAFPPGEARDGFLELIALLSRRDR